MDLKFDSASLERLIITYLIKNKSFFLKAGQYLKTSDHNKKSYFQDSKLQWLINFCCAYYTAYNKLPNLELAKIAIEKKFKDDPLLTKALNNTVDEIYNKSIEEIEPKYIEEETINFIRKMRAVEATLLNQIDIQNGNLDGLSDRMQDALNINFDKDLGLSLADTNTVIDLIQKAEEDSGMTFGSPNLDRILGSPKAGEITVFCGTPGVGKTIWLGNVAVENMKLGKKGVFFSLEVDKKRLAKRLYSSLLMRNGIDLHNITKEEVETVFASFEGGDVRIKNYPANTASCNDFAKYLMDLYTIEGYKPDFICVDYILITAPNSKRNNDDNMYSKNKIVTEEIRNLAVQFECPVFTAAQINRNGQGDKGGTKGLVTSKDLAESRAILDTADYLLIINQTDAEKKLAEKDGISEQRLYIDKNRNGSAGEVINITLNYNTMTIKDGKKPRSI